MQLSPKLQSVPKLVGHPVQLSLSLTHMQSEVGIVNVKLTFLLPAAILSVYSHSSVIIKDSIRTYARIASLELMVQQTGWSPFKT